MQPHGPYPPYPPFPAPPPKKDHTVLIIVLVVVVVVTLFAIPLTIGVVMGVRKATKAKAPGPASTELTETYVSTNGLIKVHYPSAFAARRLDSATVFLVHNLGGGLDEVLTFGAVENPVTDDPHELGRILLNQVEKNVNDKGGTWTKTGERSAQCIGKYPGVEIDATWRVPPTEPYVSKSCFFVTNGHGYEVRYDVASSRAADEEALLVRIENALELLR